MAVAADGWEEWVRTGRSAAKGAGGSGRRVGGRVGVMGLMGGRAGDEEREDRGGVCCACGGFVPPAEEAVAAVGPAAADVDGAVAGAFDVRGEIASVCIVRPGMVGVRACGSLSGAAVFLVSVCLWTASECVNGKIKG